MLPVRQESASGSSTDEEQSQQKRKLWCTSTTIHSPLPSTDAKKKKESKKIAN